MESSHAIVPNMLDGHIQENFNSNQTIMITFGQILFRKIQTPLSLQLLIK